MDNELLAPSGTDTTTPQPAQTTPEPPSLRETLEKVIEKTPIEAPAPDRDQPDNRTQAQKDRDQRGRFLPRTQSEQAKARDGAAVPTQEEVDQASGELPHEETQNAETSETAPSPSIDNAPKSWKSGPREKWAGLDPDIRAEIHRRERESGRAIAESAPVKRFAQSFQEAIQPFAQRYGPSGLAPLQIMQNLMQADTLLATAPMAQRATFMAKLINDYGIDVRALDAALSGGDPGEEPLAVVDQLINQRLAPIKEFVDQTQAQRQAASQRTQQQAAGEIEQMARDTAKYPHFDLVAADMADIIEMNQRRRIYLSPEEAYKRAVAMNPEAQQAEQSRAGQQRAQVAHDAATRSLGASLSVSGSPAGLRQTVAPDDLRGTIEAAWQAHAGR